MPVQRSRRTLFSAGALALPALLTTAGGAQQTTVDAEVGLMASGACSKPKEDSAADTHRGMAMDSGRMDGMSGMDQSSMMPMMQAHMDSMMKMSPEQMSAMMAGHEGKMSKMMDQMMSSMFDMKAADMVGGFDKSGQAAKELGDRSMGEVAAGKDPHFRERMKITIDVMMGEMIPLMEKMEPAIRESLTGVYAGKFDVRQLGEMNTFFATPTGAAYADQAMLMMMDPEVMKSIQGFAPELMRAMPGIMTKMEAATKHLPPPPKEKPSQD